VLLVSHYFPPHIGGIENVVQAEVAGLATNGNDVTVLTTAVEGPAGAQRLDGYSVLRLPAWNEVERRTGVPFPVVAPWPIRAVVRSVRNADVVHCHDVLYMTTWIAVLVAALVGTPVVLTQHVRLVKHPNRMVEIIQMLIYRTIGRAVVRWAARIAVLNGSVRDFLLELGAPRERITLVPNGVDVEMFSPATAPEKRRLRRQLDLPDDTVLALFVGRFVPKKGYDKVLGATDACYTLVLAGGPSPVGHGDRTDAVFVGSRRHDELAALYRACDVFVLPSESEGFPLTIQEAMACGLPVVTSDDPGYRIYGLDRERVQFIRPTVPEIRSALRRLAADASLRRRMGEYSLEVATSRFPWSEHVNRIERLYADAIGMCRKRVCDAVRR
jgi:glycosyltransferase involved in cell wall biosynthesis